MKKIAMMISGILIIGVFAVMLSPTANYIVKSKYHKIETAAQLNNAIEILEQKNLEMQDKYINLSTGIHAAEVQINNLKANAERLAAKPKTQINIAKYTAYTNGIDKLMVSYNKLLNVREGIRKNIIQHKSNIELLRVKLVYLDSLKTMNSYMKDVDIDTNFGTGINSIVEAAIANEEAVSEALSDIKTLHIEMDDM